jgi:glutathione S-transferase
MATIISSHNSHSYTNLTLLLFLCLITFTESIASTSTSTSTTTSCKAAADTNSNSIMSPIAPKIKLTYFDIEGAGEPIRLALVLAGADFEDVRLSFADWPALKPTTPYGQLPIMTVNDGPVRTQSGAMLRWVGATLSDSLYPANKMMDIEEAVGVFEDLDKAWMPSFYMAMKPANFGQKEGFDKTDEGKAVIEAMRTDFVKNKLPGHLTYLTNLLEKNDNKWLASTDAPTIADCKAVVFLRSLTRGHIDFVPADCLETHPKIVEYLKRFCALEQVKGRYTSGVF